MVARSGSNLSLEKARDSPYCFLLRQDSNSLLKLEGRNAKNNIQPHKSPGANPQGFEPAVVGLEFRVRIMSVPLPAVLVVDDEKNMRLSLKTVLSDERYSVRAVDSAEEALNLLGQEEFFMAITDARLGG